MRKLSNHCKNWLLLLLKSPLKCKKLRPRSKQTKMNKRQKPHSKSAKLKMKLWLRKSVVNSITFKLNANLSKLLVNLKLKPRHSHSN